MIHSNPEWQISSFDLARDYPLAKRLQGANLDADNPDLRGFFRHGGKLILYHGWQDAAIPPENTIDYYQRVERANPKGAASSVRLFMVPGMSHCLMGPGPNVFDALGTLDGWRQGGTAPERMTATKFDSDLLGYLGFPAKPIRTRPLCAYPKVARWNGSWLDRRCGELRLLGTGQLIMALLSSVTSEGLREPPLLDLTIGAALVRAADLWGERDALVSVAQGVRWSFAELLARADALAAGLLSLGLEPGDRIGIWSPNCAEWTLTQFAAARAGLILVTINPAYRLSEVEFTINHVGLSALVTAETFKTSNYARDDRGARARAGAAAGRAG